VRTMPDVGSEVEGRYIVAVGPWLTAPFGDLDANLYDVGMLDLRTGEVDPRERRGYWEGWMHTPDALEALIVSSLDGDLAIGIGHHGAAMRYGAMEFCGGVVARGDDPCPRPGQRFSVNSWARVEVTPGEWSEWIGGDLSVGSRAEVIAELQDVAGMPPPFEGLDEWCGTFDDFEYCISVQQRDFQDPPTTYQSVVAKSGGADVATIDDFSISSVWATFQRDNWELVVKMVNACEFNDRVWVFAAAASNTWWKVTVEQELKPGACHPVFGCAPDRGGAVWKWTNPEGFASPAITDANALECPSRSGVP
jgi:hypothetical protein